jgi:DMSO/TMAO reductase YedYZ molybdopterin-dependent catalytic subunit
MYPAPVKRCEMVRMTRRSAAIEGFAWGVVAGLVLVALMYLASALLGLRPLPQALNDPLLSIMPGFVFGFLIDTLQHAGKVVEEVGLAIAMVAALGVLGAAWSVTALRWHFGQSALVFAGIGWLVVVVVLLPLAGVGFLGLDDGPTTPLVWAVLFAVYGVLLQLGGRPSSSPAAADPERRRLLSALPLGLGAASLGLVALLRLPNWYQAIAAPPESGITGISPEITPVGNFYIVSKNFTDPVVDGQRWRLSIGGLVDRPQRLSLQDLRALPSVRQYVTLECISNDVGGDLISTGSFTGVKMSDLIAMASPRSSATWAAFQSTDDYAESLPLSLINSQPSILVAYDLDGAPLPTSHGYPARVLVPGHYGMKGPKWLTSINLVDHESGGYWEQQGWDHNAVVKTTARFDMPHEGDIVKLGAIDLAGVAYAGTRGVTKVEYSTDRGSSWTAAVLSTPLSDLTWVLWKATWTPASEGSYTLLVRATDRTGAVQGSGGAASYPGGAAGYHTIRIDVAKA